MIPVNEPILDGNEKKYLNECIETGWISSEGPFVRRFEEAFAQFVNRKYAVSVVNGSMALDAAVIASGISPGDEIIMPTFTIISCAAAIVRAGGIPVLVDSEPDTWNMDVTQIERKITKKTRAIMVVHIYGLPVEMNKILSIARKYKLKVIEDSAEAHGLTCHGRPCGSFGEVSTFSFYPNKHITTGEGGMIVSNSKIIADKCRSLRNLCFQENRRFVHSELGWNLRMSNVQAALGVAQIERINEFIVKKRSMGKAYTALLSDVQEILLPTEKTDYADNIYWVYGIVLKKQMKCKATLIMDKLKKRGIGTRPFFWCMHEQPVFKKMGLFKNERYPVAERLARMGFYLPSGLALKEKQINIVGNALKDIIYDITKNS